MDLPSDGRRPNLSTRKALEAFAVSAALAIEHASLRTRSQNSERRYRHLASHDALTGLGNRSMLMERLNKTPTGRAGAGQTVAVIFVDLDRFKPINDVVSHDAGDQRPEDGRSPHRGAGATA